VNVDVVSLPTEFAVPLQVPLELSAVPAGTLPDVTLILLIVPEVMLALIFVKLDADLPAS
jgi:hypothetical protein